MIKAIIVDDEQMTRKGLLEFVDWKKFDIQVVGEATDGLEGLELAKKVKPDIAICDVKMPKMNGIALAENILEILPHCKIIFLSGYSDKEYLKSAIKIKAMDYIEKPFNMLQFEELLHKTVGLCIKEKEKMLKEEELFGKMQKSVFHFRNSLLTYLFKNEDIDLNKIKEILELINLNLPLDGDFVCIVFKFENNIDIKEMTQTVDKVIKEEKQNLLIGSKNQEAIIICPVANKEHLMHITDFLKRVIRHINKNYKVSIAGAMGSVVSSLSEVKTSYEEALEVIKDKAFKNMNSLIVYDSSKDKSIIRTIEKYIQKHYEDDISINSIAAAVYLTPQYLCKVYKKETGDTLNDYITKVRIQAAKELLEDRRLKLYEVAYKVGYKDANYFARVFKKLTGINPSEYRDVN